MSGALELGLDSEESLRRENALESAPCPVQCPASEGPRSSWPAGDGVERNCVLKRGRCRDRNVSVLGGGSSPGVENGAWRQAAGGPLCGRCLLCVWSDGCSFPSPATGRGTGRHAARRVVCAAWPQARLRGVTSRCGQATRCGLTLNALGSHSGEGLGGGVGRSPRQWRAWTRETHRDY